MLTNKTDNRDLSKKRGNMSKLKLKHVKYPTNTEIMHETESDDTAKFCPFCQMPLSALNFQSQNWHVSDCIDHPLEATQECPSGLTCDDTTQGHYRRLKHTLLANRRAGIDIGTSQQCQGAEASTMDIEGLDHAKRKLQFSSSKKLLPSLPTESTVHVITTPCDLVKASETELSIDQAKKKLSFSVKKCDPSVSSAIPKAQGSSNVIAEIKPNDNFPVDCVRKRECSKFGESEMNSVPLSAKRRCSDESKTNVNTSCDDASLEKNSNINSGATCDASDDDIFGEDDDFFRNVGDMLTSDGCSVVSESSGTVTGQNFNQNKTKSEDISDHAVGFGVVKKSQYFPSSMDYQQNKTGTSSLSVSSVQKSSMRDKPAKKDPTQTSISSFFRPKFVKKSATVPNLTASTSSTSTENTHSHTSSASASFSSSAGAKNAALKNSVSDNTGKIVSITRSRSAPRPLDQLEASEADGPETGPSSGFQRKCPFYKKMPGTPFTVDAFRYGSVPGCRAYFLTHFHYDHYGGLRKSFAHPIYCSKETANLVEAKIKVDRKYLNVIALDTPTMVHGVEVTFMDANHCPGSVLILFKLPDGRKYLHTGDFRACPAMELYPALTGVRINQLYLDTTYCDPTYSFPPQDDVIRFAVNTVADFLHEHPNALIAVGSYTIGKERVFMAIAESLNCRVNVTREKKNILDCLEDESINKRLTLVRTEARVHVLAMKDLKYESLTNYLEKLKPRFDCVLAFEPTGWTHSNKVPSLDNLKPKYTRDPVTHYGIPYSEHSSYTEMKQFCQFIKAQQILPTVNNGSAQSRRKMELLFKSWMAESPTKSLKQQKLAAFFSSKE